MLPWLFLAGSVWGALFTLNAFYPAKRLWPLVGASFFAGWLTTELALHHLIWQTLFTAVLISQGVLSHVAGIAGAALAVFSWVGLGWLVLDALRDSKVFKKALDEALGESDDEDGTIAWGRVLFPFWFRRSAVQRLRNIHYVEDGKRRHRLDVFRHRDTSDGAPVLLQIHGGAWTVGSKDQQGQPLVNHMAAQGFVCVATNYALSPNATWPDHLVDCKRALKWVRENIAEYGGDPNRIIVTGGSAGGHLTAMLALTAGDPRFQPGFEDADTSVSGFIPFYGVFDWTNRYGCRPDRALERLLSELIVKRSRDSAPEIYDAASPMSHVNGDIPPVLVVHGRRDNLAPVTEARRFVELLRERSSEPVAYVELPGAHHAFEVYNSVRTLHAVAGVERFCRWLVAQPAA